MKKLVVVIFAFGTLSACGSGVAKTYPEGANLPPQPESAEVYITKATEAEGCEIKRIADLKVSSKTYGGASRVNRVLKQKVRKAGGNAVIAYSFWVAPGMFAWAAPHCKGTAVLADLDCLKSKTAMVPE